MTTGKVTCQGRAMFELARRASEGRHAVTRVRSLARFLQLKFFLGRKSFVFSDGEVLGVISWCHVLYYGIAFNST